MYTFPFVMFLNIITFVPVVTLVPVVDNPSQKVVESRTYTVSTKCPSEIVGIQTPTSKIYHSMLNLGLSCINVGSPIHKLEFKQVCV